MTVRLPILPRGVRFAEAPGPSRAHPAWLAGAALATTLVAGTAHADPGAVELRSGGRVNGNVVAVLPNDRVMIQLPDGSLMTFPWGEVRFVYDGSRTYDTDAMAAGSPAPTGSPDASPSGPPVTVAPPTSATISPPPAPPPSPLVGTLSGTPTTESAHRLASPTGSGTDAPPARNSTEGDDGDAGSFQAFLRARHVRAGRLGRITETDPWRFHEALPGRAGSVSLITFGSLMAATGIITLSLGATDPGSYGYGYSYGSSYHVSDRRKWLIGWGVGSLGLGAAMISFGVRRSRVRSAGIDYLQSIGYPVLSQRGDLDVSFAVANGTFAPRLRWTF